jgi:hypothetical protein
MDADTLSLVHIHHAPSHEELENWAELSLAKHRRWDSTGYRPYLNDIMPYTPEDPFGDLRSGVQEDCPECLEKIPKQHRTNEEPKRGATEPNKNAPHKHVDKHNDATKPVDKPVEVPSEQVAERPADKAVEVPAKKVKDLPAQKTEDVPAKKAEDLPANKVAEKPADKVADVPADKPAESKDSKDSSKAMYMW